jgi:hypothetical protein
MLNADSGNRKADRTASNLVRDVGPSITDISVHLPHDANVLVAVQQRVLLVPDSAHSAGGVGSLVGLETGI